MSKLILNEDIHELDIEEKHNIKNIIKSINDWLWKEKYEDIIDRLDDEINKSNINCRRCKTRCKTLAKENKELKERIKKNEME